MSGLRKFLLLLFPALISLAVCFNTISNLAEAEDPALALKLNPFNNDALIQLITNRLEGGAISDLAAAEQLAIRGVYSSRGDARIFSMLGVVWENQGKRDQAQALFEHALVLLPTESYALLSRFSYLIDSKRPSDAVEIADVIYRRWKEDLWPLLNSYWPYILSDKQAFQKTVRLFDESEGGKASLMASLYSGINENPEIVKFPQALITEWINQKSDDIWPLVNEQVDVLLFLKKPDEAHALFISALDKDQQAEIGYVFNSQFNLLTTKNFFDWKISRQKGITINFTKTPDADDKAMRNALDISFLNNPVEIRSIWQNLKLPAGSYTLSSKHMTNHLRAPKIIRIYVSCDSQSKPLVDLPLPDTRGEARQQTFQFTVPNANCEVQRLWLGTEFLSMSWKNRFNGTMRLFDISILEKGGTSN